MTFWEWFASAWLAVCLLVFSIEIGFTVTSMVMAAVALVR